jgi:hypothetical protein
MTVQELIDKLSKIKDKNQRVYCFNDEAGIDDDPYISFNQVLETYADIDNIVLLEWEN